jgi:hypothetical protein
VLIVRGVKRFRERVDGPSLEEEHMSTTALGDWYATVLPGRPQVALFVNEMTLLPVFMPLAPARGVLSRLPLVLAEVFAVHGLDAAFISAEIAEMVDVVLGPTRNRSVVGIMNEFTFLAGRSAEDDLLALSVRLAGTPCGPLFRRHVSPDRELHGAVAAHRPR